MDETIRVACAHDDRRFRRVHRFGRAATYTERIRSDSRGRLIAVHAVNGRIRARRRPHGPALGPVWCDRSRADRRGIPQRGVRRRRLGRHVVAVQSCAGIADGVSRHIGDLRAADCRYFALVQSTARHRSRHLYERQLFCRRRVVAHPAAFFRDSRLAGDIYRHGRFLCAHHVAARIRPAPPSAYCAAAT